MSEENQLITERREKLAAIRQRGIAFPNDFKPKHHAAELLRQHGDKENEELEPLNIKVVVAGRMMLKRVMGKASFATLQDATEQLQLFVTRDALGEEAYAAFKHLKRSLHSLPRDDECRMTCPTGNLIEDVQALVCPCNPYKVRACLSFVSVKPSGPILIIHPWNPDITKKDDSILVTKDGYVFG